jgi:hypothetical protein
MKALGRIGDETVLPVVEAVKRQNVGLAAVQARFAAALISHRLGLAGNDLPVPDSKELLGTPPDVQMQPIQVASAEPAEAARCMAALATRPFGIPLAQQSAHQLLCGGSTRMVVLHRDLVDPAASQHLTNQKSHSGIGSHQVCRERKVRHVAPDSDLAWPATQFGEHPGLPDDWRAGLLWDGSVSSDEYQLFDFRDRATWSAGRQAGRCARVWQAHHADRALRTTTRSDATSDPILNAALARRSQAPRKKRYCSAGR